ncbi:flagellar motor protein MotB [Luedemannella flava]|uniref:Flagellar motor protein MotB n=1 Tax=Luedemannella flava TaxID=349316 RepID=A0ABP4Y1Q7_9ACTN
MSRKVKAPRRRPGGHHEEEHQNHERWLVTYADMITLLMVLFIVMFSMSAVDTKKFSELASALAVSFGAGHSTLLSGMASPIEGQDKDMTVMPKDPGADPNLKGELARNMTIQPDTAEDKRDRAKGTEDARAAEREVDNLREVQRKITAALEAKRLQDSVQFHIDERGLVVTVVTSAVVFAGDRADLLAAGRDIVDAIAPTLRKLPNRIQVDGHTNQLPVPTVNYPSAWELSTARASAVVRRLAGDGLARRRLSAAGYADTRPLVDPNDARSVIMNRRVDVVVLSTLPSDQAALLPSVAG